MAGRTTRSDSSMAIDALKDAEVASVLTFFVAYLLSCTCTVFGTIRLRCISFQELFEGTLLPDRKLKTLQQMEPVCLVR